MVSSISRVEDYFAKKYDNPDIESAYEKIRVLEVDHYVTLGQFTALRFLEWVAANPGGVIALPTGKTPEFFIKWTQYYLENWQVEAESGILKKIGLDGEKVPDMKSLPFFQLDEFFPIHPEHERSFQYFIRNFYINGLGLDPKKAHLIDTYHFSKVMQEQLGGIKDVATVFPDGVIDLSLRVKHPANEREALRKQVIKHFDQFCEDFENDIRKAGGIGFFLGGIGPDGHIAFNVRGSSHHSHTRLTQINYETQAAAATDLGGIEEVRKKAVITMGLGTIVFNPDAVVIIIAAGQSKARVVADAVQKEPNLTYPAGVLQKLPHARFFVTRGAASHLEERKRRRLLASKNSDSRILEQLMLDGALKQNVRLKEAPGQELHKPNSETAEWPLAASISGKTIPELLEETYDSLTQKIEEGLDLPKYQRILHTAPHHDDIELAYFPLLHHLVRSKHNENFFCYCTSGFTAVTNGHVQKRIQSLFEGMQSGLFFNRASVAHLSSRDFANEDITGYLGGIADQNPETEAFFVGCRLARQLFCHTKSDDPKQLLEHVKDIRNILDSLVPGRPVPEIIQLIKGWIREFEAELVWAHFGIGMDHVHHLNLQFYSGNIFPEYPDPDRDVLPILRLLEKIQPTVVSLALDPEGSGPDTHFKTLIALAKAIDLYVEKYDKQDLRVWGYRNIWSRWHPADVNHIIPISLNSFAVLHNMFDTCFLSQKSASFPSFELDGTFSRLAQKIWVEQYNDLVKLLGRDFFYQDPNPMMRRSYGAIYLKDMSYSEFKAELAHVDGLLSSKIGLKELE